MPQLSLDLTAAAGLLAGLGRAVTGLTFEVPLKTVAVMLGGETKRNFETQAAPSGEPWAPLKNPGKKRGKNPKILRDTGLLMASYGQGAAGNVSDLTAFSLTWGSNVDRAGWHQRGVPSHNLPAREQVGVTDRIAQKTRLILDEWVAKVLAKAMGN